MTLELIQTIANRVTDHDGLSARDRAYIEERFGHTREQRTKISKALTIFGRDLYIDAREKRKLIALLNLNNRGKSFLDSMIEHDGMGMVRRRFANYPAAASVLLRDTSAPAKVRAAAALRLASSNNAQAMKTLTAALKVEQNWSAGLAIAKALINLDSRVRTRSDVVDALVTAYHRGDKATRGYVLSRLRGVRARRVTDIYIAASQNPDRNIRLRAVRNLVKLNDPKATQVFFTALKDPDSLVRREAVPGVARLKTTKAYFALIAASARAHGRELKAIEAAIATLSKDPSVQAKVSIELMKRGRVDAKFVAERLKRIKSETLVSSLTKMLSGRDAKVRYEAAKLLRKYRGRKVIEAFNARVNDIEKISSIAVKYLANEANTLHRDAKYTIPGLIAAMSNKRIAVRYKALQGMIYLQEHDARVVSAIIDTLKDPSPYIACKAADFLRFYADSYPQVIPAWLVALKKIDKKDIGFKKNNVGWAAAQALLDYGQPKLVPILKKALKHRDSSVRAGAAYAAGILFRLFNFAKPLGSAVAAAMKDKARVVQTQATWTLAWAKDPRAAPFLVSFLKHRNATIREGAVALLGQYKRPKDVKRFLAALRDPAKGVRKYAAISLGTSKDRRAASKLILRLKDSKEDKKVREWTAWALGEIGDTRAATALVAFAKLKNISAGMLAQALRALGKLKHKPAFSLLTAGLKHTNWYVRWQAVLALDDLKDRRAVPALIAVLTDTAPRIPRDAVKILGEMKDLRAVPALIRMLGNEKGLGITPLNTAYALAKMKHPKVVSALIAVLNSRQSNKSAKFWAIAAVEKMKAKRAIPALNTLIKNGETSKLVRDAASSALKKINTP